MPEPGRILIYSPRGASPRLGYIVQTLFGDFAGLDAVVTTSREEFLGADMVKVAYGHIDNQGVPSIPAAGLLFETGINSDKPDFVMHKGMPVLFPFEHEGNLIPFDIFAASFWLLSRYEEYQPYAADAHGRFPATEGIMHRAGLLLKPIVNTWLHYLLERLKSLSPAMKINLPGYHYLPTFDIDTAWAFRHKPIYRQAGGLIKSLINRNFKSIRHRLAVLSGKQRDPFDTYDEIISIHNERERPLFFFLVGERGTFDRNTHPGNRHFRELVRALDRYGVTALHPSYGSCEDAAVVLAEAKTLGMITGRQVTQSRQHFLRIKLPTTCRVLIESGIMEDYSMGFADQPGFRAGTCSPFMFYDLERDEITPLRIFPLTVMDGTLRDYMQLTPPEATGIIQTLHQNVRAHHGTFISLWHNESLGEIGRWTGWSDVYRQLVNLCSVKAEKPQNDDHQQEKNTL
jgi:hypothetical protein